MEFKENVFEIAFGDEAINKDYTDEEGFVEEKDEDINVLPSEFLDNKHKTDKTHIVWFNR